MAALVCGRRVPRCPSKSTLVASTTASTIAPTKRPPASRTSLLPFRGEPRGVPHVASSIFLPHSCTEDDQVRPPLSRGSRGTKEGGTEAMCTSAGASPPGKSRESICQSVSEYIHVHTRAHICCETRCLVSSPIASSSSAFLLKAAYPSKRGKKTTRLVQLNFSPPVRRIV